LPRQGACFGINLVLLALAVLALALLATPARSREAESEAAPGTLENMAGLTVTDVVWSGNKTTRDFVIRREIRTLVGDPLVPETVKKDIVRLENLGIFSSVKVITNRTEGGVALQYIVREMPSLVPYITFSLTDENGLSLGPAVASINFLGRGATLAGSALFGGTTQFNLDYMDPWITGDHVSVDFHTALLDREDTVREFQENSFEVTPWVGSYFGEKFRGYVGASYFRMEADRDSVTLSGQADNLIRVGMSAIYDSRDNWRDPGSGWRNEVVLQKTGGFLGGDGDFWTALVDLRRYQPLLPRQTLALGAMTTLQSGVVGTEFPSYLQFVMGGANSIRGYQPTKLGREVFGQNQFIFTAEYRVLVAPIREYRLLGWSVGLGWQAAAFLDVGSAWAENQSLTGDRTRLGYGAGIRLLVPGAAMVRFDVGISEDRDVAFYVRGLSKFEAQRERIR